MFQCSFGITQYFWFLILGQSGKITQRLQEHTANLL